MSKTNNTKINKTINEYNSLHTALCKCKTKHELVDTMLKFGFRTTTKPTDTINLNDLYIQFFDKSRVLITKKSLKLYTCDSIANCEFFANDTFDKVNDGSYRTNRLTVANTVENFNRIFDYFITMVDGCENNRITVATEK